MKRTEKHKSAVGGRRSICRHRQPSTVDGRQRGSQILELALVLPLLLFITMVVLEGAEMVRRHQVINNAAREGAHLSAMHNNSCQGDATCLAALKQAVVNYAAANNVTVTASNVALTQNNFIVLPSGSGIRASQVTVTLPYTYTYMPRLFNIAGTWNLVGRAEFRNFY